MTRGGTGALPTRSTTASDSLASVEAPTESRLVLLLCFRGTSRAWVFPLSLGTVSGHPGLDSGDEARILEVREMTDAIKDLDLRTSR